MNNLIIEINWVYFLGIMGALIAIAYTFGGHLGKMQEAIGWLKNAVNELKIASDNENNPAFNNQSPVRLNEVGEKWLTDSGLKEYIDSHKDDLTKICEDKKESNPYELQLHIFKVFDELKLEGDFENKLKEFAFDQGVNINIVRRVGAIYFRDICLTDFGMSKEEIDKHDPAKG